MKTKVPSGWVQGSQRTQVPRVHVGGRLRPCLAEHLGANRSCLATGSPVPSLRAVRPSCSSCPSTCALLVERGRGRLRSVTLTYPVHSHTYICDRICSCPSRTTGTPPFSPLTSASGITERRSRLTLLVRERTRVAGGTSSRLEKTARHMAERGYLSATPQHHVTPTHPCPRHPSPSPLYLPAHPRAPLWATAL